MADQLTSEELKRLARLGAAERLRQIDDERRAILRAFPGLAARAEAPVSKAGEQPGRPRRKRRKMTAAEKKAASERMRKFWAAKKQG